MSPPYAIHWFRRDLRVDGNPALLASLKKYSGKVVGLFCFDSAFLSREDFSHVRFQFFLKTLAELKKDIHALGGELLVVDAQPANAFKEILSKVKSSPQAVSWNRDYEPFARRRDTQIEEQLKSCGIEVCTESDHLIIEPQELLKSCGKPTPYQIFTPFSKVWLECVKLKEFQRRIERQQKKCEKFGFTWKEVFQEKKSLSDSLEEFLRKNSKSVTVPIPQAGAKAALRKLKDFESCLKEYATQRDIPSVSGTSQLSIYLKNGSITTSKIISELSLLNTRNLSAKKYLIELIWREFYYHILYFYPEVEKQCFKKKYDMLKWQNDEKLFEAWKEGRTGFPIVDAGMRQLNATGWMHNRVRMIVASFLTKDLLIDWRWGEKYFMQKLLDGDLAPNNGGWQWAASTGCDAQPYFRIFNPESQSKKFDPSGEYIKKWIPELKHLPAKLVHAPAPLERGDYPSPVVDHAEQREKALALFSAMT